MGESQEKKRRRGPPAVVIDGIRKRVSKRNLPRVEVLFALRGAAQQRKLIARLSDKGEITVDKAFGVAMARFSKLFTSFSREELATLTALLNRVRDEFMPPQ